MTVFVCLRHCSSEFRAVDSRFVLALTCRSLLKSLGPTRCVSLHGGRFAYADQLIAVSRLADRPTGTGGANSCHLQAAPGGCLRFFGEAYLPPLSSAYPFLHEKLLFLRLRGPMVSASASFGFILMSAVISCFYFVNTCLTTCEFPASWKHSFVRSTPSISQTIFLIHPTIVLCQLFPLSPTM